MRLPALQHRSVLITGCSSGIGATAARFLRERGWQVIPTARKPEDLERLRADGFTPVELDAADTGSVARAAGQTLERTGGKLGGLVNNAGFGQAGAMEDVSRDQLRGQFEVNLFGLHDLTCRFIPLFRRQGWGRIVNISSVLGRISMPLNGSYSSSKFALEGLSDALRIELRGSGVGVALIEPGPIESAFRANAVRQALSSLEGAASPFRPYYQSELRHRLGQPPQRKPFTLPPEAVAARILTALTSTRPRARYCVTLPAHAGAWLSRWAPTALVDRLMSLKVPSYTRP